MRIIQQDLSGVQKIPSNNLNMIYIKTKTQRVDTDIGTIVEVILVCSNQKEIVVVSNQLLISFKLMTSFAMNNEVSHSHISCFIFFPCFLYNDRSFV